MLAGDAERHLRSGAVLAKFQMSRRPNLHQEHLQRFQVQTMLLGRKISEDAACACKAKCANFCMQFPGTSARWRPAAAAGGGRAQSRSLREERRKLWLIELGQEMPEQNLPLDRFGAAALRTSPV